VHVGGKASDILLSSVNSGEVTKGSGKKNEKGKMTFVRVIVNATAKKRSAEKSFDKKKKEGSPFVVSI